jgi:hypothetical protein
MASDRLDSEFLELPKDSCVVPGIIYSQFKKHFFDVLSGTWTAANEGTVANVETVANASWS